MSTLNRTNMDNKVYIVIELYTFEFATDYRVSVYHNKEKAAGHFHDRVNREKTDSWIKNIPEDKLVESYSEERLEYDAYEDGNAAEYETTIVVEEKEVW